VSTPVVTLLTDYGVESEFAGICRGVIQRVCPGATVIDITHGIARHAIRDGALVLRNSLPFMPTGVHVTGVVSVDEAADATAFPALGIAADSAAPRAAVPIETGTQDVTASVVVVFSYGR